MRQVCEKLSHQQLAPSDEFLPLIIDVQRIIGQASSLSENARDSTLDFIVDLDKLATELTQIKRSISFPLHEHRKRCKYI